MDNEIQDDLITITEFKEFMYQQIIPIRDIVDHKGVPIHKMFPFWRRHKILPFIPVGKHWFNHFELSFLQLIWLRLIDSLRQLNYPLIHIKILCEYFFKDPWQDDLPEKILLYNKEQYETKEKLEPAEQHILNVINQLLEDKDARVTMNYTHNYLSELVAACLNFSKDAGILLYPDGKILEHVGDFYFNHRDQNINFDINAPHIYISIKYFLKEFLNNDELQNIVVSNVLNDDEKTVLEALRNENIEELIIKKEGRTILRIDSSNSNIISGDKAREIKKILGLRNYEEIEISTRDEKTLKFKKKSKRILTNKK